MERMQSCFVRCDAGLVQAMDVFASTRHAAERGLQVIVVDDACAAWEEGFPAASPSGLSRYFTRIASTGEVVSGIARVAGDSGAC